MDIIFNPPVNEENKYIEIMVRSLEEQGYIIHSLDNIFSSWRHFQAIKLVHLNWFENVDDSNFHRALKSFARKCFVLTCIRISKKKLVWTMHNRISHEKRFSYFNGMLTRILIRWSHRIIIHCDVSRTLLLARDAGSAAKIVYLPHPDFIGTYGPFQHSIPQKNPDSPLSLLFLGAVKPYKNLELLILATGHFKEQVKVVIAGNPLSPAYHEKITQLASKAGNVEPRLEFIPDQEIRNLVHQSDLMVLPYDLESSLNSGTAILAFSYRKTVICPEIGTISDLGEAKNNVLHYHYEGVKEHLLKLKQTIQHALDLRRKDNTVFSSMGQIMYEHVALHHNKKLVGERLVKCYRSLLD